MSQDAALKVPFDTKCAVVQFYAGASNMLIRQISKDFTLWSLLATVSCLAMFSMSDAVAVDPQTIPLIAGQHISVGTVTVDSTPSHLSVSYQTTGGWVITETHLDVAVSYSGLNTTKKGNPIPGKFRYKTTHPTPVNTVTYNIDASQWVEGTSLYLAAHAVVISPGGSETAWADGLDFPGANWATYFVYEIPAQAQTGSVHFSQANYPVQESSRDTSVIVAVKRTGGSSGNLNVHYRTIDGTAVGSPVPRQGDYLSTSGTLTFADGDSMDKTFAIRIFADPVDMDQFETFSVELTSDDNCCLGDPASATITIEDFRN